MLTRAELILLLLFFGAHQAHAQTVTDFQAKYGKSVDVYSVSEHILMTPEYANDGQVCKVRLTPKRVVSKTKVDSTKLVFSELRGVLNDLVPLEQRGNKKPGFGMTDLGGGTALTNYEYENVLFTFISFYRLTIDPKTFKSEELVLFVSDLDAIQPEKNLTPQRDDFATSDGLDIEVVRVTWAGRKCVRR